MSNAISKMIVAAAVAATVSILAESLRSSLLPRADNH
jgi:hypothetical protein